MSLIPTQDARRRLLAGFIGDTSDRQSRNTTFIYCYSIIGIVLLSGLAVFHASLGIYWLASFNCVVITLGSLNVAALAAWRKVRLAENVSLLVLLFSLLSCLIGSTDATSPYWFASFPPIAFFLKGLRSGLIWISGMLLVLVGLIWLQDRAIMSVAVNSQSLWLLIVSLVTLCLLLAACQTILFDAEARLAKRTCQLTREIMQRQSMEKSLRRTEEKLRFLAHHDPRTGLPNRALFYDRLEHALTIARHGRRRIERTEPVAPPSRFFKPWPGFCIST